MTTQRLLALAISLLAVGATPDHANAAGAAFDPSTLNGDGKSLAWHELSRGEVCIIPRTVPALGSGTADPTQSSLCAIDFYDDSIGICAKANSTNPGVDVYKLNGNPVKATFESTGCKQPEKKRPAKKIAKFKQSITCSDSASILAYYELSQALGGIGDVPPAVIRTMSDDVHKKITQAGLGTAIHGSWAMYQYRSPPGRSATARTFPRHPGRGRASGMVRIIGSYISPYVRKVLVALDVKGLSYEIDPIIPFMGDDRFSTVSPVRRIPVLMDDRVTLADSSVICQYLEDRYPTPALFPVDIAQRARARWLEEYADTRMGDVFIWRLFNQVTINPFLWGEPTDQEILRRTLDEEIPQVLGYLESELPAEGFLFGDLSIADIAIAVFFRNAAFARFAVERA